VLGACKIGSAAGVFGTAEEKIGTAEEIFGTAEGFAGWAAVKIRTAEESFGQRAMAGPAGVIDARWRRFTSRMSPLTEESKARLAGMGVLKSRGDQRRGVQLTACRSMTCASCRAGGYLARFNAVSVKKAAGKEDQDRGIRRLCEPP
jgi:hypothetical protein